jgi:hypothetical protein
LQQAAAGVFRSLRAVGARVAGTMKPKERGVASRLGESQEVYGKAKLKWEL